MYSRNHWWEALGTAFLLQRSSPSGFRLSELQRGYCFHFPWPLKENSQFGVAAKFQMPQWYKPKQGSCFSPCLSKSERIWLCLFPTNTAAANGNVLVYIPTVSHSARTWRPATGMCHGCQNMNGRWISSVWSIPFLNTAFSLSVELLNMPGTVTGAGDMQWIQQASNQKHQIKNDTSYS